MRSRTRGDSGESSSTTGLGSGGAPGKRTLVEKVYASRARGTAAAPTPEAQAAVEDASASSGAPLPEAQRETFEQSLGIRLADVRVHTGEESASAAGAIEARAYAVGQDIHFGAGQYQPGTPDGDRLLAHEVAHTVQQRGGGAAAPQAKLEVSSPGDAAEVEADAAAEAMVTGAPASVSASAPVIARDGTDAGTAPAPAAPAAAGGTPAAGGAPAAGAVVGTPTPADVTAAETFAASGAHGPQAVVPSTGMGGFDATYTPTPAGPGNLQIEIHAAVNFVDPITNSGGNAVATHTDYAQMATRLNALPAARRAALLPQFTWSTAADERQAWMDRLKASVESAWSQKHEFHVHQAGWDWIGSKVSVNVVVAARTARDATDHLSIDAVKTPPGINLYSFGMSSWCAEGSTTDAHDQTMRISSEDVSARPDDLLRNYTVNFGFDSDRLDSDARSTLTGWVRTFQGDPTNPASHAVNVEIIGHTSRSGTDEYNQGLSERRVASVVEFMRTHGFTNIATRVSSYGVGETFADQTREQASDRQVEIVIQHDGSQVLAAHEFGHAFGLGDQYATSDTAGNPTNITGTGAQTGGAAAHDGLAKQMIDDSGAHLPGAIYENNDSIMSGGTVVRAEHYATFAEALRTVSGVNDWALGPPHAKAAVVAAASGGGSTTAGPPTPAPTGAPTPAPAPGAT